MRTTLDLDDAVLAAARSLAKAERLSLGAAVSRLARRGLGLDATASVTADVIHSGPFAVLIGDPEHLVTPDLVEQFRDGD
ncbi:MAG TPA: hypothetical protein PLF56_11455 [Micropruina sp.]|jgi:hypothetical protein|nr:hypothetical protein [Micropruina sp.]